MTGTHAPNATDGRIAVIIHAERIRVLVVGAGPVAERKALAFAERGAAVRVVAPRATHTLIAAAAAGTLDLILRQYATSDIADAELVVAATDDRGTNARVASDARDAHRLCNVADLADEGSFSSVAQSTSGPLLVAVGANGVPAAASRILAAVTSRFDARYDDALVALRALRERLLARGSRDEWERASTAMIGDDFIARVEDGRILRDVARWP